jgi:hypothetical protein
VTLRVWTDDEAAARRQESELRVQAQRALREAGIYTAA